MNTAHLHLQLGNSEAAIVRGKMIAVPPGATDELGAVDNNLGQLDALAGGNPLGDDAHAGVEAEDQTGIGPVRDEVPAGEQDLSRGRDGGGGVFRDGHGEIFGLS